MKIYNTARELNIDPIQLYKDIHTENDKEVAPFLLTYGKREKEIMQQMGQTKEKDDKNKKKGLILTCARHTWVLEVLQEPQALEKQVHLH